MLVDQYGNPLSRPAPERSRRSAPSLRAKYDAAQDTPENRKHWAWADHDSALAANSIEVRRRLRSRARYECHQANSFAKGICHTLANDTISTGPALQVTHQNRELAKKIEREWRLWARKVGLAAKLRTARLSKVIDGEIFILKSTNRRLRTPVQLDIKLVESDQISTPGYVDGLPDRVDGIEFDKWGQPTNYHMLKTHPGDVWALGAWEKDDIHPDDIIHMFRVERPGQVRGIPEITPALPLFAYLRRWTLSTIAASETAANLSAVIETMGNDFDDDGPEDVEPFSNVEIDRNMMVSLPRGWKMNQFKPEQPTTGYEVFRNAILGEIARCVHMPSNKALADSSRYNYSSGRLDHQTYYESIGVEQSQWAVECLDRIFEWWLDEALMLTGYLDSSDVGEVDHEWRWNPPKHVDPQKEVGAAIDAIDAGLLSEERYLLSNNIDPEEHYQQLIRQAVRRRNLNSLGGPLGNTEPPAPRTPSAAPVAQSAAAESELESGESPTGEFKTMSRRQLQNATKAVDDAIDRLRTGEWSETRTRVFLSSVGFSDRTINSLLDEVLEEIGAE